MQWGFLKVALWLMDGREEEIILFGISAEGAAKSDFSHFFWSFRSKKNKKNNKTCIHWYTYTKYISCNYSSFFRAKLCLFTFSRIKWFSSEFFLRISVFFLFKFSNKNRDAAEICCCRCCCKMQTTLNSIVVSVYRSLCAHSCVNF